jgi:sarcosine oxidase subunit gamma
VTAAIAPAPLALALRDVSSRPRFGCKGAAAEAFLASLALPLPAGPNGWVVDGTGRLVARLATSEFLIEDVGRDAARTGQVADRLLDPAQRRPGLVPVLRQDRVLELTGPRANELLLQTCNVDFALLARDARSDAGALAMTSMIGVGVIVVPRRREGGLMYTIWADPSYGHYLWSTLVDIAMELGGAVLEDAVEGGASAP